MFFFAEIPYKCGVVIPVLARCLEDGFNVLQPRVKRPVFLGALELLGHNLPWIAQGRGESLVTVVTMHHKRKSQSRRLFAAKCDHRRNDRIIRNAGILSLYALVEIVNEEVKPISGDILDNEISYAVGDSNVDLWQLSGTPKRTPVPLH